MHEACLYHPSVQGEWNCPHCETSYCGECAIWKDIGQLRGKEIKPFCPKCNSRLQWVGAANLLPPFWDRLHRFFTYPFHKHTLLFLLALAVASVVASHFIPVFGWMIHIAAYFFILSYSYEMLKTTARGDLYPPPLNDKVLLDDLGIVAKQFLLLIALLVGGYIIAIETAWPVLLAYILFVLIFAPAILIVLITTERLLQALNPVVLMSLVWRIGPAYLLMYFFLLLLMAAPGILVHTVGVHLPGLLQPIFGVAANYYYLFVSFHLIGYVLLQYHMEIGYEVDYEDFRAPEREEQAGASRPGGNTWSEEQHAESLIQNGRFEEALDFLGRRFEEARQPSMELCRKYFRLLYMKGCDGLIRVGEHLVRRLVEQGEKREARSVYQQCLECDGSFLPDAESLFWIADAFDDAGEHKCAVNLYQSLYRNYPQHTRAVEAVFRLGFILNEHLLAPEKARQVLEKIVARHPDDPLRARIENYLRHSVP